MEKKGSYCPKDSITKLLLRCFFLRFGDALHAQACFAVEAGEEVGGEEQHPVGEDGGDEKTYEVGDAHEKEGCIDGADGNRVAYYVFHEDLLDAPQDLFEFEGLAKIGSLREDGKGKGQEEGAYGKYDEDGGLDHEVTEKSRDGIECCQEEATGEHEKRYSVVKDEHEEKLYPFCPCLILFLPCGDAHSPHEDEPRGAGQESNGKEIKHGDKKGEPPYHPPCYVA